MRGLNHLHALFIDNQMSLIKYQSRESHVWEMPYVSLCLTLILSKLCMLKPKSKIEQPRRHCSDIKSSLLIFQSHKSILGKVYTDRGTRPSIVTARNQHRVCFTIKHQQTASYICLVYRGDKLGLQLQTVFCCLPLTLPTLPICR